MEFLQEPPRDSKDVEHVLFIDSRYTWNVNPDKANVDFYLPFNKAFNSGGLVPGLTPEVFRNVKSVELCAITFPTAYANETKEPYVILDIDELNERVISNVPGGDHKFAIIFTEESTSQTTKMIKGYDFDRKIRYFDPPMSILGRLSFKFLSGKTQELIEDYGPITMTFKITTKVHMV